MKAAVIAARGAALAMVAIVTLTTAGVTTGAAAVAPPASAPAHGHQTYYAEAFNGAVARIRPSHMQITENAVDVIRHVHWATWKRSSAKGHGVVYADNCKPNCAEGHYRKDPAHITLLKTTNACGKRFFVKMRLHYTGKKFPSTINRHQRYIVKPDTCNGFMARPAAGAAGPSVMSCLGKPSQRPANAVVDCANATLSWRHVTWATWRTGSATGHGTATINSCNPTCVAAGLHHYPAKISLSRVRHSGKYGALFTRATISYTVHGNHHAVSQRLLAGRHRSKPALAGGEFFSPLGSLACEMDNSTGLRRVFCAKYNPNASVTLSANGAIKVCTRVYCTGDAGENTPTLRYGKTAKLGPFQCLSSHSGVLCTARHGAGFLISPKRITRIVGY